MNKPKSIDLRWDTHIAAAPHCSNEWAATDRGWLFATGAVNTRIRRAMGSQGALCLGHYLDYVTPRRGEADPTKTVHAVSCVSRESAYFGTPDEAKAWIESRAGNVFVAVIGELRKRGVYEHVLASFGAVDMGVSL